MPRRSTSLRGAKAGVALIIVLWLSAVLTLLMYAFLAEMRVEYALAGGFAEEKQAEQLAWSGIDAACAALVNDPKPYHEINDLWSNDRTKYFEIALGEGSYTLIHPTFAADLKPVWGIDDEASKININVAPKDVLMRLPRVNEEVADSIIDWRDEDSTAGPSGAEDSYYQGRTPSYGCKNQPFETVEELLFVRGVDAEILYGEDANLNGRLDPNEDDGDQSPPTDNKDGRLDPGLWSLVTVVSVDRNVTLDGQPRINLNTAAPEQLQQAGFQPGEVQAVFASRFTAGPFQSLAQLLGDPDQNRAPILTNPRFKAVVDRLTLFEGEKVPGLVNVNTAPRQVLMVLPGITEEIAVKIVDYRTQTGADLSNIGWLTDVVEPATLRRFANAITVHSYQFRIHAVGRVGTPYDSALPPGESAERPRAFKRMVAVFDKLATPRPRLVYWKDLTKLGLPYVPEDGPTP